MQLELLSVRIVLEQMATDLAEEAQAQATADIPVAAEMDRMVLEADVDDDDSMVRTAKQMMTKMNVSCSSETEYERKVAEVYYDQVQYSCIGKEYLSLKLSIL